ncbi:universal stress protein PHOS32-like isoform X1 [Ananas comosus]|uniref:Universal stress protein PHOS32-like isoform X1 n=2 Tax=Ananas comosus TaxID=4615 RepID=A0A6P5FEP4_ANACO|nr:universal stress protein PHOS32-like isoform X1 [Ananas comosus]
MGRTGTLRIASFCLNRVATRVRLRTRRSNLKPNINPAAVDHAAAHSSYSFSSNNSNNSVAKPAAGRRIMVAGAGSRAEAKAALEWALSHAVQGGDTVVLLDVLKLSKHGNHSPRATTVGSRGFKHLRALRSICQTRRPEVKVEISLVEGKERGPAIVEEARKRGISLLVLGQKKKRAATWQLLLMMWASKLMRGRSGGVAEYCIQNASCMTLAVRRKGRNSGGYLITSRRHKDFWLLA